MSVKQVLILYKYLYIIQDKINFLLWKIYKNYVGLNLKQEQKNLPKGS